MTKISQLPAAGPITGTEMVPVVQGGVTKQAAFSGLVGPMGPTGPQGLPGDPTLVSATSITATGGTTTATLADRFGDRLHLKRDFGAVGNGVADDGTKLQAALTAASGKILVISGGPYLVSTGNLTVPANVTVIGEGFPVIQLGSSTLNPLFNVTGSNVVIEGLDLLGNLDTQKSSSSGSAAINVASGLSNIHIRGNRVRKWTRHGIVLGGVTSAFVTDNLVTEMWHGAGIYSGANAPATNVHITGNTVTTTQWANIQLGDHDGLVVSNNVCDGTNLGSGSMTVGAVADNITSYPYGLTLTNAVFADNVCRNSGNHGMHLGGPNIAITGNTVENPTNFCILISAGGTLENPNQDLERVIVANNSVITDDRTNAQHKGISIRNVSNFVVTGNVLRDVYDALEIRFIDETVPTGKFTQAGVIVGNSCYGVYRYGCELNGFVRNCAIFGNVFDVVQATDHIRYNTDASIAKSQNPTGNNVYAGSGAVPRSWQMHAGDSGTPPALALVAAATNAAGAVLAKGNAAVYLGTENGYGAEVTAPNAATVNRIGLRGNPAGQSPTISATGTDTNLNLVLTPKGTGVVTCGSSGLTAGVISGSVTATGTTTARTLADRFADAVSVKDFGAVGDGVADDKAEIQAAIDAVSTAGGGVVFVPEGTYTMSLRVTVKAGVTLAGAGIGATTLKVTDHDRVVVLEADSGIRNISLDANGQHDAVVNKLSVLSVSGDNCVIDTVEVIDGYSGISVGGADEATAPSNTEITNVYTHDNVSRGLILDPFANGTIVNGIHSWGNGNAGILIGHGAFNNLVTNFVLEDINNASLWLHEGAHDNVVCNGVIKNPALTTSVGVNFSSGAYNNRVSNVHISGYARAVQFVGEFIDGVYPAILDHDTSGNEIDGIVGYGNDNTNVNSYAVTFQQTSGSSPIAIDNVVRNCSFTNYYGVFRNVSDAANGCQIANIKTASVGAGGVFKGMKSTAGDVVRVSNVQGFVTRAKYQTATFSIASTGTKTPAAISHGLPYTPPLANCSASLLRDPTNGLVADFRLDHLWVVASTSTDLTARAQVGSASATGTAVQAMIVTVDMCAEDGFNCSLLT